MNEVYKKKNVLYVPENKVHYYDTVSCLKYVIPGDEIFVVLSNGDAYRFSLDENRFIKLDCKIKEYYI